MIRKIKLIGLVPLMIAYIGATEAPAVQASELHATDSGFVAILGSQGVSNRLTTGSGTVVCNQVSFEGVISGLGAQTTAQELTLTPIYTGCQALGVAATVNVNGCKFTTTNNNAGFTTALTANVDITGCTAGKTIEVSVPFGLCVLTVPQQNSLGHIMLSNNGGSEPHDVTVNFTITGIQYQAHGVACGVAATTALPGASYHGQATLQAREYSGTQPETHNGHQYQKVTQIGLAVSLLAT